jgi:hypothetical protein
MDRTGHDSPRAAMIYLRGAQGADRAVADDLPVELDDESAQEGHGKATSEDAEGGPAGA